MKPDSQETPIQSIHKTRRAISDKFDGNISAIAADANERLERSGRPIWKPSTKKSETELYAS